MRRRIAAALLAGAILLVPGLALAQEEEHGAPPPPAGEHGAPAAPAGEHGAPPGAHGAAAGEHGYHSFRLDAIVVQFLGLTILAVILAWYAVPPAARALRGRRERIREALDSLEREEASLVKAKSDAESKLRELERESIERMQRALKEGAKLRETLVHEGDEAASRIGSKAKMELEIRRQRMLLELRNEVLDLSLKAAAGVLRRSIDRAAQDRLVDRFIEDLQAAGRT